MIRGEFEAGAGVYLPGLADTGCDASRERASSRDLFRVGMGKRESPLQMSTSSLESWTLNYFEVTFSDIRTRNYLEEVTLPIILNIKLEICTWGKLPNLHTSKCLVVDDESDPDVCVHVNSTKI